MGQQTNDNFIITAPKAVDDKYCKTVGGVSIPYASVDEANGLLSIAYRYRGLTILVDNGGGLTEYWYRDGTANINLIIKTVGAVISQSLQSQGVGNLGGIPSGTVFNVGTSIEAIIRNLLINEIAPTYTPPTVSLTSSVGAVVEKLSSISPLLTSAFTQNDAGSLVNIKFNKNGSMIQNITQAPFVYTDPSYAISAAVSYQSNAFYGAGPIKNTNLGNPSPGGQIQAGNILSNIITITPVYPYFYGTSATGSSSDVQANMYSGSIGVATNKVVAAVPSSISISSFGEPNNFIWFAVPTGSKTFTTWYVTSINQGAIGGGSNLFASPVSLSITSTLGWTQSYDIYVSNYVTTVSGTMLLN